jgi:hypothetical protein
VRIDVVWNGSRTGPGGAQLFVEEYTPAPNVEPFVPRPIVRVCAVPECHETFSVRNRESTRLYCSNACYMAAYRARATQ